MFASLSELNHCNGCYKTLLNLKKDMENLNCDHLDHAAPVIAAPLAALFTCILRHGYMLYSFCLGIVVIGCHLGCEFVGSVCSYSCQGYDTSSSETNTQIHAHYI